MKFLIRLVDIFYYCKSVVFRVFRDSKDSNFSLKQDRELPSKRALEIIKKLDSILDSSLNSASLSNLDLKDCFNKVESKGLDSISFQFYKMDSINLDSRFNMESNLKSDFASSHNPTNIIPFRSLKTSQTLPKVLLVELNTFHIETIFGVEFYLKKLGFDVVILLREEVKSTLEAEEKELDFSVNEANFNNKVQENSKLTQKATMQTLQDSSRIQNTQSLQDMQDTKNMQDKVINSSSNGFKNIFASLNDMFYILNDDCTKKFDFIFFNTMVVGASNVFVLDLVKVRSKYGILGIYHTISDIVKFGDFKNYSEGRYFALRDIEYKYQGGVVVLKGLNLKSNISKKSPLESININLETKNKKSSTIHFTSVGFALHHKNFKVILLKIIRDLEKNGIKNFRFNLISRDEIALQSDFITIYKNPSKSEMEEVLSTSHFIFAFYDSFAHRHYLRTSTSGQRALSLEFNIPLLINEPFASAFNFTPNNAVIFKNSKSVESCIKMSAKDYLELKNNLAKLDFDLTLASVQNLSSSIEKIKSNCDFKALDNRYYEKCYENARQNSRLRS
ncbi:MAG: hypothetical protein K2P17_08120 [Helicobacteraceae bacterium]|nr:hypothetical protein [Helicobacteraceae bacterium]